MHAEVNESLARRVLEVVDAGLVPGMGAPEPGKMCVEAAVCFAMGLPHSDEPTCVAPVLRRLKIRLNDLRWSSNQARSKGLRRLAIAQLGSAGALYEKEFAKRCGRLAIQTCVPAALRAAASLAEGERKERLLAEADLCEREPTEANARAAKDAAYAASDAAAQAAFATSDAAAYAADAAAYAAADRSLADFAEGVVQILIEMHAPGCQWLWMTEEAATCST